MKAIGQFDEDDTDIRRHGKDHLPDVLGLALFTIRKVHFADFCDTVYDIGRFFAKKIPNFS